MPGFAEWIIRLRPAGPTRASRAKRLGVDKQPANIDSSPVQPNAERGRHQVWQCNADRHRRYRIQESGGPARVAGLAPQDGEANAQEAQRQRRNRQQPRNHQHPMELIAEAEQRVVRVHGNQGDGLVNQSDEIERGMTQRRPGIAADQQAECNRSQGPSAGQDATIEVPASEEIQRNSQIRDQSAGRQSRFGRGQRFCERAEGDPTRVIPHQQGIVGWRRIAAHDQGVAEDPEQGA
ncbi:MAG TPA: hypothetical protein VHC94_04970 [Nitrobacter sp.]|nr:hypothetical protein [Nitrobacter sp.]